MDKARDILLKMMTFLGVLSVEQQVSITNVATIVFISITAFRALFGGLILTLNGINWTVQPVDFASTLPLLYALFNYANKRMEINKLNSNTNSEEKDNESN